MEMEMETHPKQIQQEHQLKQKMTAADWDKQVKIWVAENEAWRQRRLAGEESEEDELDAMRAAEFKDTWNSMYSSDFGPFEEPTQIPNKRFTYKKPKPKQYAGPLPTLQIISLKVARIKKGLQWPFHVFGMVAVRDAIDRKRNIIFDLPRHKSQILTQEVPCLKLTGPTRAVVALDPITFEIDLKVKGATESEDKCLSFLAATYVHFNSIESRLLERDYKGKLCTLLFELGAIVYSVEATITLRVKSGSWPDGFRAQFAASTDSIGDAEIILLDSGDDKVPVAAYYGSITLSRCVVSVELDGRLRLSVKAWQDDEIVARRKKAFRAKKDGTSAGSLDVGFCTMDVSIAWSLMSVWH